MSKTLVTVRVQAVIEHDDWDDEDKWIEDYNKKLDKFTAGLSEFGTVDVESEEPWE